MGPRSTPHLSHISPEYHVLVPDLPGHGQSSQLPFSVQSAADLIAQLIREKAKNARAHVVGHSLGARVAIQLACNHPDVVDSVFVSGFAIYPRMSLTPCVPYVVWALQRVENLIPRSLIRWAMDGTDLPRTDSRFSGLSLCQQIMAPTSEAKWPAPWPARALIIVVGKGGLIPSADRPSDAIRLMQIGREQNPETIAYMHSAMRYPWCRQAPKLFADTAQAWIEGKNMPPGFTRL